jgi:AmmeMemoRadiSam system protein B
VDRDAVGQLAELEFVAVDDRAHAPEHCLEVELPFLQCVLGDFALVPILVGLTDPEEVATALDRVWGGPETVIVVSSDLSHWHDANTARRLDQAAARAIEQLRPEDLTEESACGRWAIAGLLIAARRRHLTARTLDLRNSGDTAGSRDGVVGYGAWVFA